MMQKKTRPEWYGMIAYHPGCSHEYPDFALPGGKLDANAGGTRLFEDENDGACGHETLNFT